MSRFIRPDVSIPTHVVDIIEHNFVRGMLNGELHEYSFTESLQDDLVRELRGGSKGYLLRTRER